MKFYLVSLLTMLGFGLTIENVDSVAQNKEINDITGGILKTILNNRDFGSNTITFSEWRNPNNELYIVPFTDENTDVSALGLGYTLYTHNKIDYNSLDFGDVVEIREQNITAMGFPLLWNKGDNCDGDNDGTANTSFSFGTRKFMLVEVNNQALGFTEVENNSEVHKGNEYVKRSNEFSNTETFLFFGIGDINDTDRSVVYETLIKYITIHTTTTFTSTYGVSFSASTAPIEFFSSTENGLELLMPVTSEITQPTTTTFLLSDTEVSTLPTSVLISEPKESSKIYQESFWYNDFISTMVVPTSSFFNTTSTSSQVLMTKIMGNSSAGYTASTIKSLYSLKSADNNSLSSSLYLPNSGSKYFNISSENDGAILNQYRLFNSVTGVILFFITSFILM